MPDPLPPTQSTGGSSEDRIHALEVEVLKLRDAARPELALLEEAERHRVFLRRTLNWTTTCVIGLIVVASAAAVKLFGDQVGAAADIFLQEETVRSRINKKIDAQIKLLVPNEVSDEVKRIAPGLAQSEVDAATTSLARASIDKALGDWIDRIPDFSKEQAESLLLTLVPIGSVIAWPGHLPPSNDPFYHRWHECDGSQIPVSGDNDPLRAAIGGVYGGAPDGHVRLPDFRGMFLRGAGGAAAKLGVEQPGGTMKHHHLMFRDETVREEDRTDVAQLTEDSTPARARSGPDGGTVNYHITAKKTGSHGPFAGKTSDVGEFKETRPVNYTVHWVIRIK